MNQDPLGVPAKPVISSRAPAGPSQELLNVCADGQVCSGYRERDADPHLRRLVRPTPGSSFVMESVGSDASGPRRK